MSLINDALNRAREVQNPSPAPHIPGPPPGRTEEEQSEGRSKAGMFGAISVLCAVLVAFGLLLLSLRGSSREPSIVKARTIDTPAAPAAASTSATANVPAPTRAANPVTVPMPALAATTNTLATNSTVGATSTLAEVAAPAPPQIKLQAIVFNPRRPSAIINGRTLFIGDRFQDMRVVAITSESATLAGAGKTNRLRLGE